MNCRQYIQPALPNKISSSACVSALGASASSARRCSARDLAWPSACAATHATAARPRFRREAHARSSPTATAHTTASACARWSRSRPRLRRRARRGSGARRAETRRRRRQGPCRWSDSLVLACRSRHSLVSRTAVKLAEQQRATRSHSSSALSSGGVGKRVLAVARSQWTDCCRKTRLRLTLAFACLHTSSSAFPCAHGWADASRIRVRRRCAAARRNQPNARRRRRRSDAIRMARAPGSAGKLLPRHLFVWQRGHSINPVVAGLRTRAPRYCVRVLRKYDRDARRPLRARLVGEARTAHATRNSRRGA